MSWVPPHFYCAVPFGNLAAQKNARHPHPNVRELSATGIQWQRRPQFLLLARSQVCRCGAGGPPQSLALFSSVCVRMIRLFAVQTTIGLCLTWNSSRRAAGPARGTDGGRGQETSGSGGAHFYERPNSKLEHPMRERPERPTGTTSRLLLVDRARESGRGGGRRRRRRRSKRGRRRRRAVRSERVWPVRVPIVRYRNAYLTLIIAT